MAMKLGKVGKQKSRSAAKKRLRKTGTGQWAFEKAAHNHLLMQKSKRQKNKVSKFVSLSTGEARVARRLVPGS
ncbi:MAG: bL35 family ribosomal protein [Candidatus Peregrinibacteria bacterium]